MELEKMVREFDTEELQRLLTYAGAEYRCEGKRKHLLNTALYVIKFMRCDMDMMVRQIYKNKIQYMNNVSALKQIPCGNIGNLRNIPPINPVPASLVHAEPYYMPLRAFQRPLRSKMMFKELPLYDKLYEVLPPTSLSAYPGEQFCERNFSFCLTPYQVSDLQNIANAMIHMRIGLLDTKCEQSDIIPPNACIKVNGTDIRLPLPVSNRGGPKRIIRSYPLDITFAIKKTDLERNSVYISWVSNQPYVFAVYVVKRQPTSVVLKHLMSNAIRSSELTKTMIMEKFQKDRYSDISTMSVKGSLICPIGKVKMEHPCRVYTCDHLQCFDVKLYVEMNANNPKWICPICHEPGSFEDLIIDGLFLDIIRKSPSDCIEVEFHEDGSWTALKPSIVDTSHNCVTVLDESFEITIEEVKKPIEVINLE